MPYCIITGGTSSIGRSTAYLLAKKGWHVILACRNMELAQGICDKIMHATGNQHVLAMKVDLSSLNSVNRFILDYSDRYGKLDILINHGADTNLTRKTSALTDEGHEVKFATNHLAPFALVNGFMPLLMQSEDARIINVSSKGLSVFPNMEFDFAAMDGMTYYSATKAYFQSKLAQIMFSISLKERINRHNIAVYCIRVPNVKVSMKRVKEAPLLLRPFILLKNLFAMSPKKMAKVYSTLATTNRRDGLYFDEAIREVKANQSVYDKAAREKLWILSEALVKKGTTIP